jgi:hypothetical protein
MEDDLLLVGDRMGDHARPAHLRARARRSRDGDDRRDLRRVCPCPPVVHVLQLEHGEVLAVHQGYQLADVEPGATAERHHTVVIPGIVGPDPSEHVGLDRIGPHVGEDHDAEPGPLQVLDDGANHGHRGQARIGNEQRACDAGGAAMVGQLSDTARPELDRGWVVEVPARERHVLILR